MKFIPYVFILFTFFSISCDDDLNPTEIPSVIENTFKSNFPHATDVEWERYGDNFEVDFEFKKADHSARIEKTGNLLEYKFEIEKEMLPPTVISRIQTEFADSDWEDAEILVRGKNRYYQLEIDGFLSDKKIILDSLGNKINNIKTWE